MYDALVTVGGTVERSFQMRAAAKANANMARPMEGIFHYYNE